MTFRLTDDWVGNPPVGQVQATEAGMPSGQIQPMFDPYFGSGEVMWMRAGGVIPVWAAVTMLPTFNATTLKLDWVAIIVANTANQSRPLGVAMQAMALNDYGWVAVAGCVPIASNASVAANGALGVAAAGQLGAAAAGKNVFGAVVAQAGATTIVKAGCSGKINTKQINVPNTAGIFIGQLASGTGVAALAIVTAIDEINLVVTVAVNNTASTISSVTFANADGTIQYNVSQINRPSLTNITV